MKLTFAAAAFALAACLAPVGAWPTEKQANPVLRYEPAVVTLAGTLSSRTYAGPPNYEDIRAGDRPETYWILQLENPVNVLVDENAELDRSELDVCEVQLVFIGN